MHKAHKTIVASKRNMKKIKTIRMSVVLENANENHVTNTYLKMQIPMMWRKFFKNIAENRYYVYKCCNNPSNNFHRHCFES